MLLPLAPLLWLAPPPAPPLARALPPGGDLSRRFPLRREGGGTRGACVARLVAQLVPPEGRFDPGAPAILAVIEGASPEPAPLVLRWAGGEWIASAGHGASLRLLRLPQSPGAGLWEVFPACEGSEEPAAPPARSLLRPTPAGATAPAVAARAADAGARSALDELWRRCGMSVSTAPLLERWAFPHLAAQLPASLPVLCATAPLTAPRSPLPADGR